MNAIHKSTRAWYHASPTTSVDAWRSRTSDSRLAENFNALVVREQVRIPIWQPATNITIDQCWDLQQRLTPRLLMRLECLVVLLEKVFGLLGVNSHPKLASIGVWCCHNGTEFKCLDKT